MEPVRGPASRRGRAAGIGARCRGRHPRFAREHGLRVAAQGTGHNARPLGSLEDTVLVKTARMRQVSIDPVARIARAEAGAVWHEVIETAAEHGLAALAGSSPDVGVVGYTIGGGISWLGRAYGLAANNVEAIELVTADGRLVRADACTEPDLFWALRGGGGSFGVVTAIELRLFPIATEQGAGYAADSYARLRGVGALVTTFGVGELSALNAIAGAYAESVPVVHIVGTPALAVRDAGATLHHNLPGREYGHFARMAAEVTAAQADLRPDTAAEEIDRALSTALRTSRPVYLTIPANYHAGAGRPVLIEAVLPARDAPPLLQELTRALAAPDQ